MVDHIAGIRPHRLWAPRFVTTPAVVGIINSVLAASLAATIALLAGLATEWSVAIAIAAFLAVAVTLAAYQLRSFQDWRRRRPAHFPTPASVQHEGAEP